MEKFDFSNPETEYCECQNCGLTFTSRDAIQAHIAAGTGIVATRQPCRPQILTLDGCYNIWGKRQFCQQCAMADTECENWRKEE